MGDVVEVDVSVVGGEVAACDPVVDCLSAASGDVGGLGLGDEDVLLAEYFALGVG